MIIVKVLTGAVGIVLSCLPDKLQRIIEATLAWF
jgi:hypothetical protein